MNKKIVVTGIIAAWVALTLGGCGCSKRDETPSATATPTATVAPTATPAETPEAQGTAVQTENDEPAEKVSAQISSDKAMEEIQKLANELMGEGTIVLPSAETPKEADINGEKRMCYMFGAAKIDLSGGETESSQIKNFYFDADTGEIFEIADDDSITKIR